MPVHALNRLRGGGPLLALLRLIGLLGLLGLAGCATGPDATPAPPPPGAADIRWQPLARGVDYAVDASLPASRLHLLRIDLRTPGLRLAVSPPVDKGLAPDRMPSGQGALLSINASFFDARFNPVGITASAGQRWSGVLRAERTALFGCDAALHCGLRLREPYADEPAWQEAVGGVPWLLREGRARTPADDAGCESLCARTHPRTALGLDASRRWLLLVLAEGRRPGMPGLSLAQLAEQLRRHGLHEALNLDGGGSSMLLIRGQPVMARPANEPALRAVANAVHVFVDAR